MDEKIRFVIDANTIEDTLIGEDYETIGRQMEGQPVGPHRIAFMAARFMVDEQGKVIPHADALRILNKLPGREYKETLKRFSTTLIEVMVPNAKGEALTSPSQANSPKTTTPPDGSLS
jgi:hypothetical protein